MPEEYILDQKPLPPVEENKKPSRPFKVAGLILGAIALVGIGIFLGTQLTSAPQQIPVSPTATPTVSVVEGLPTPTPLSEVPQIKFLPGKQYFDDTYVVIQQEPPYKALILSVSRIQQEHNFLEYTKVNYFNGQEWDRKTVTTIIQSATVATNPLLPEWNSPESSAQRASNSLAFVKMPKDTISFTSSDLQNEISVQSLPGSTKFIYQGKGALSINGEVADAYVFYSRTYSFNAADLSFLTQPESLTSDWLLFWDTEGTFYYIDTHQSKSPTSTAQIRRIGVREDNLRKVLRTNKFSISLEKEKEITYYLARFDSPINDVVMIPLQNTINKAANKTYTWNLGIAYGRAIKREGRAVAGVGIIEHIKPN